MLKWTPKAESDLDEILEHIAKNFNVDLAFETIYSLMDFVEKTLSSNPLAGMLLESNPIFSKIVFEGNSIFYCENPQNKYLYIVYVQPRWNELKEDRLNTDEVA